MAVLVQTTKAQNMDATVVLWLRFGDSMSTIQCNIKSNVIKPRISVGDEGGIHQWKTNVCSVKQGDWVWGEFVQGGRLSFAHPSDSQWHHGRRPQAGAGKHKNTHSTDFVHNMFFYHEVVELNCKKNSHCSWGLIFAPVQTSSPTPLSKSTVIEPWTSKQWRELTTP